MVCRTTGSEIEYRSKDPNVLETAGWVNGTEMQRVRVWEEKEKATEYLASLDLMYPQLSGMEMVRVMAFTETGIIGVMEN